MIVCTVCGTPPGLGQESHLSEFLTCRCRLLWMRPHVRPGFGGSVVFGSSSLRFSLSSHSNDQSAILTDWFRVKESFPDCDQDVSAAIGLVVAASVMDQ